MTNDESQLASGATATLPIMDHGNEDLTNAEASRDPARETPRWIKPASIAALAASLLIYVLRLDQVVGLVVDDAWYVLLAKALAEGQGYSLINSPSPGILPLYPPGFPFLLSLFFRVHPNFPENVWLLKSVSIAAMMVVGILCYRYFTRVRELPASVALGIAVTTVVCPPLVFLATSSVMSDCVFTLWFVSVIVATEACKHAGKRAGNGARGWQFAVLAAAFSSAAFLTRSIAVSLIAAAFLYLLKERLIRSALIFAAAVALFSGPWMIYSRLHAPTHDQQMEQGGNMVLPYTVQFWQKVAGDSSSGTETAAELPRRVWMNSIEFLGRDVCRILMAVVFESLRDPFKDAEKLLNEKREGHGEILLFSLFLSLFVVAGFFAVARERVRFAELAVPLSLAVIVLWPFETIRYVLPLAPFVIFYFLMGLREAQRLVQRALGKSRTHWSAVQLALVALIAINLFGNIRYIANLQFGSPLDKPQWISKFEEAEKLFEQIRRQAPKTDTIVALNPAIITLYTGHKTVSWDDPAKRWELWKAISVRYMVWVSLYPQPVNAAETNYRVVYLSREGSGFRILDLGPPETRIPWAGTPNANAK